MPVKKKRFDYMVCKPCWEIHYCPYGPLVEFYPLTGDKRSSRGAARRYRNQLTRFANGIFKTEEQIHHAIEYLLHFLPGNWRMIEKYDHSELECRIFGHICPVFFVAEPFTETKAKRKVGRSRYIPRDVMLKVVRRDGQMCQLCGKNVPDNEVAFDHVIPISKGGPTNASNIRLLCSSCNSRRSNSTDDMLDASHR